MSENKLQAVLWDLDGVIADTGNYHFRAWREIFTPMGIEFTEEHFVEHFGQRNDTIIRDTVGQSISQEELDAIADRKEEAYRRLIADNIQALPGAVELLKTLEEHDIPSALASSAPPENVNIIVSGLGIGSLFRAIACGREVTEGKPSPQVFLLAAQKLKTDPAGCVVIEDAVAGVAGAKRAGMKCVAVTNSHSGDSLREADLVVTSLEDVSIDKLESLFN
jgi:beta-phosphoglucomutase family hydrolase